MRLASLPQRRDGRLIVVSADLAWYADADHIVPDLQSALDDWDRYAPLLETLSVELEHEAIPRRRFHEREACAPLPRAFRRTSAGAERPGDDLAAGRSPIADHAGPSAIELCVVTGDVPQGASRAEALAAIRLVGLVHDCGAGALSPVFATPEAFGPDWADGRLGAVIAAECNGQAAGSAAADCDLAALVADLAATRRLLVGTVVGSGALLEIPALAAGDVLRAELRNARGKSLIGAMERTAL